MERSQRYVNSQVVKSLLCAHFSWLARKLNVILNFPQVLEFFHFGCTSEDINNFSHVLAPKEGVSTVMFLAMVDICKAICSLATQNAHHSMLAQTHGQV
jgi:adenylosuccinate lyase